MSNLGQTNENINQLSNSINKTVISTDNLGRAFKSLSAVLPIRELIKIEDAYSQLHRISVITTKDLDNLKSKMEALSKVTDNYAKHTLVEMSSRFLQSTSSLTQFTNQHEKLIETFTRVYRQDAPRYLDALTKVSEQMPVLALRTATASRSMNTLIEVFQRGGPDALSAYQTSLRKVGEQTSKTADTLSDAFKRLETSYDNLKTKIGSSGSTLLKPVVDFAAENPMTAGIGLLGASGVAGNYALNSFASRFGGGGRGSAAGGGQASFSKFGRYAFKARSAAASNVGGMNGFMAGAGLYAIAQASNTMDDEEGRSYADQGGTYVGRYGSIGGAVLAGGAVGGPLGALAAGGYSVYQQASEANDFIAQNASGGALRKAGIEKGQYLGREQAKLAEALYLEREQNAISRTISEKGIKEGTAAEASFGVDLFMKKSEGYEKQSKAAGVRIEDREHFERQAVINTMNARNYSQVGLQFANSEYASAASLAQFGLEFGGKIDTAALGAGFASRRGSLGVEARAFKDDPAKLNEIAVKQLQLKKEEVQMSTIVEDQDMKRLEFAKESARLGGATLNDLNAIYDAQVGILKVEADRTKENEFLSKKFENQARAIEAQKSQLTLMQTLAPMAFAKQSIGLTTMSTPSTQGRQMRIGISELDAKLERARQFGTPEEVFALEQEQRQAVNAYTFNQSVTKPLYELETQHMGIKQRMESQGMVGATGQSTVLENQIAAKEKLIELDKQLDDLAKNRLKVEIDALKTHLEQNKAYGVEREQVQFEASMANKQVSFLQSMKMPAMMIMGALKEAKQGDINERNSLRTELEMKRNNPDTDPAEIRRLQSQIKDKEIQIAQKFDVQRRTYAEQFTAQMINMPSGSYLNPNMTSQYSLMGSGYYTGKSQGGGAGATYQSQMEAMFGPGMDERSGAEQVIEAMLGAFDKGLTVSGTVNVEDGSTNLTLTKTNGQ